MDDNDSEFFANRSFIEMSRTTLDTLRTDLKKIWWKIQEESPGGLKLTQSITGN